MLFRSDINDYLNKNSIRSERTVLSTAKNATVNDIEFNVLWLKVKEHFSSLYDSNNVSNEDKEKRNEIEEAATIGKEKESKIIMSEIEAFLQEKNWIGASYPTSCYDSLVEAVFHEIYRFGVFAKWGKVPQSVSAKIKGNKMLFKINGHFVEQPERLREGQVEEIIRTLQMRIPGLQINKSNPSEEFDMDDGTRIKVMIPPRTPMPVIVFRRFVVRNYSFENQVALKTIPKSDVQLYKDLARTHLNTVIAGQVESGKSTFLKSMYGARKSIYSSILIENHPETYIWRDFPERDCDELYLNGQRSDIQAAISDALRIDHDFIMFQEVRGAEAEGAIASTERGTRGLLMTYHITEPEDTPRQLAQHIVDEFPARNQEREIKRIASKLDIGITMKSIGNGQKRVTSVYEICFERASGKAWINYLIKWDPKTDSWTYNADVSNDLLEKMSDFDEEIAEGFLITLQERELISPLIGNKTVDCL